MSDVPAAPPTRKVKSRLGAICLGIGLLICLVSLLVPHYELQGPILSGASSPKEYFWYFFFYALPGLFGLIVLFEGFRFRRLAPEASKHFDDGTPLAMAMGGLLVVYSAVDMLLFFVF